MAESALPEADANALSGTTDSDTDLVYSSPGDTYYTADYRRIQRLLQITRGLNDLRVYKDGDLTYGVRAGDFMTAPTGASTATYAGSTGNALTNDDTNYIYLTVVSGVTTLVINTTGFPNPGATSHLPLAIIITADGVYDHDDIEDQKTLAMYRLLT